MKIVGVTACPSGVAHTYMAADAIKKAGVKYGIETHVETQGSVGTENALTAEQIAEADVVVLTNDIGIKGEERFAGKPIVRMKAGQYIAKAGSIVKTLKEKFDK